MSSDDGNDIDQIANAWVARMDGQCWTEADERVLDSWLREDIRHRGAFLQAHALWLAINAKVDVAAEADKVAVDPLRRNLVAGAGAVLAASLVGAVALWRSGRTITTEVGEIRRLPLPDGSIAAINTATQVKIAFANERRDVDLERGEAWFRVSSNPRRPFVVEAGPVNVLAVGTAFSVRRRKGGADVLVTEGVVRAWVNGSDHRAILLSAGDKAFLGDDAHFHRDRSASIDRDLAWRTGRIDLQGQTVSAAIDEFNRYNRRQLILDDPALANERLDGFFRTDDVEGFVEALRVTLNIPVSIAADGEIRIGAQVSGKL